MFVSHCLYSGGSERVLTLLANFFANKGYSVTIVSRMFNKNHYPIDNKVKVIYVECSTHLSFIKRLRKEIVSSETKNIISFEYFYNMCSSVACMGLNVNLITSERNDPARVGGKFPHKYLRNFLYRSVDVLVCQTEDAKRYFPNYIQKKTKIILNPLKDNIPEPYCGERNKTIVNFCRFNTQKNLPLLIDAFRIFLTTHPDYKMEIYGDGSEKSKIKEIIVQEGLSAYVTLYPNCVDVLQRIQKAMMFVSTSDYEGLSNSMLEAMAIGLPTIATDCPCGGARMVIVNGKNGIIVPVRSVNDVVKAMSEIADDKTLSFSLGREGQKIRELLSLANIGSQWENLLR